MSNLDIALSVALGIGLAAATGFRLFLPLLILSGAAYTGHASLNDGFAWLGTPAEPQGSRLPTGPRRKWRGFCLGSRLRDEFVSSGLKPALRCLVLSGIIRKTRGES